MSHNTLLFHVACVPVVSGAASRRTVQGPALWREGLTSAPSMGNSTPSMEPALTCWLRYAALHYRAQASLARQIITLLISALIINVSRQILSGLFLVVYLSC